MQAKRLSLLLAGALLVAMLVALVFIRTTPPPAPFTVVVMPDTQHYVESGREDSFSQQYFRSQTEWIVANRAAENIVFVSHEGDLVENGGEFPIEWQRANDAMSVLDNQLPYATVAGNHDMERPGSVSSGYRSYLQWFGPERHATNDWFGGASDDGLSSYQFFRAGEWTFLHLALELEVPDDAMLWAQQVIDTYPGFPTIITTHAYQNDKTGRTTDKEVQFSGNSGESIWRRLIKPNPQIFLVLNGHFSSEDGERHQVSTNDAELPVYEIVTDYQDRENGGDGYLRLLHFDPAANTLDVQAYSPRLNTYMTDDDSQFRFAFDFKQRFGSASAAWSPNATRVPAQYQTATLVAAADASIDQAQDTTNMGDSKVLRADANDDTSYASFVRFEVKDVAGTIRRALLRVYATTATSDGPSVYSTDADWDEQAITWQRQPTQSDTALDTDTNIKSDEWIEYDVTEAVQGDGVYSFLLKPNSNNGVQFSSREGQHPPELVITSLVP